MVPASMEMTATPVVFEYLGPPAKEGTYGRLHACHYIYRNKVVVGGLQVVDETTGRFLPLVGMVDYKESYSYLWVKYIQLSESELPGASY